MNGTEKRVKIMVGTVLLLWLVLTYILGANYAFMRAPGALPLPILAGLLTPILVFLAAFWTVGPFRDFVMSIDLPVMAGIQAWRFGGLGFIALYAYGVLPGLFAWPAGLGDMAIGLTAPLVILALRRQPAFAAGRLFQVWNLLGILDLIVAVGLGATSAVLASEFPLRLRPSRWGYCRWFLSRRSWCRCFSFCILLRFFRQDEWSWPGGYAAGRSRRFVANP